MRKIEKKYVVELHGKDPRERVMEILKNTPDAL